MLVGTAVFIGCATFSAVADAGESIPQLRAKLKSLLLRYTPRHPDVIHLRRQIIRRQAEERGQESKSTRRKVKPRSAVITPRRGPSTRAPRKRPAAKPKPVRQASAKLYPPFTPDKPWTPRILTRTDGPYLPDFSYAGYHWGERPLPIGSGRVFDVSDYGAVADDDVDDSDAILAALAAAEKVSGAVEIQFPPGRFIVSRVLTINRGHITLSGAGAGKQGTRLFVPQPLSVIGEPEQGPAQLKRLRKRKISPFSSHGGIIYVGPSNLKGTTLAAKALSGRRGGHRIELDTALTLPAGTLVELHWCPPGCKRKGFLRHVFGGVALNAGGKIRNSKRSLISQRVTVTESDSGGLTIKEPLLHDIKPGWLVRIQTAQYLREVGIRDLAIVFPKRPYAGHLKEAGYNAIDMRRLANSWLSNIRIVNADSGIAIKEGYNVTLDRVRVLGRGGHFSIELGGSNNVLVRNFRLDAPSWHNPSVGMFSARNVFSGGVIAEARLDQHTGLNQQNLIENVNVKMWDMGVLFEHGGGTGPGAAGFNTFWNIRVTAKDFSPIILDDAPAARIVGLLGSRAYRMDYGPEAYIEGGNRRGIAVPSLYRWQLARRLGR